MAPAGGERVTQLSNRRCHRARTGNRWRQCAARAIPSTDMASHCPTPPTTAVRPACSPACTSTTPWLAKAMTARCRTRGISRNGPPVRTITFNAADAAGNGTEACDSHGGALSSAQLSLARRRFGGRAKRRPGGRRFFAGAVQRRWRPQPAASASRHAHRRAARPPGPPSE
jgi:hypothetical protein